MNILRKTYNLNNRSNLTKSYMTITKSLKSFFYNNKFSFSFEQEKKESKRHFTLNYKYVDDVYYKRSKLN